MYNRDLMAPAGKRQDTHLLLLSCSAWSSAQKEYPTVLVLFALLRHMHESSGGKGTERITQAVCWLHFRILYLNLNTRMHPYRTVCTVPCRSTDTPLSDTPYTTRTI